MKSRKLSRKVTRSRVVRPIQRTLTTPYSLGKAQIAAQRTARFAARNPNRLESQIEDLQALRESQNGQLGTRDKKQLEDLERDVARIKKAKESLGEKAPQFSRSKERLDADSGAHGRRDGQAPEKGAAGGGARYGGLGKRTRDGGGWRDKDEETEETDEDVRRIPWPRDTPPPIPRHQHVPKHPRGTDANAEPLRNERLPGRSDEDGQELRVDLSLPSKPQAAAPVAAKTTYESKAQVRDLRKEATTKFMPQAVRRKIDATKGSGAKLLEEEEMQQLEGQGYGAGSSAVMHHGGSKSLPGYKVAGKEVTGEDELRRLREEEAAFEQELRTAADDSEGTGDGNDLTKRARAVRLEEVSDEEA